MKNLMFLLLLLFCTCFGFSNCSPTNLCKSATKLAYPVYGIVDPNLTNNIDLYFRLCKKYNSYFALMLACLVQPRYTCSKSLIDQNLCNNQTALEYPVDASNTVPALQKKMNKKNCKIYTDSNSLAAACKSKPKYSCSIPAKTTKSGKKTTTTPAYTGDLCAGYSDYLTKYGIPSPAPCISATDYQTNQCASNADYPDDCTEITDPVDVTDLCDSADNTIYFC